MKRAHVPAMIVVSLLSVNLAAPQDRPSSPRGKAATEIGGEWIDENELAVYRGGSWIDIDYGRPILRQRDQIFGSGADYGKKVNAGAPVWRAGANQTTRFDTDIDLLFGDQRVPAGSYSLFVALAGPESWTLILSTWPAQERYQPNDREALWGAYGYTPDRDVLRAPMEVGTTSAAMDQLTFAFSDVTRTTGTLVLWWGHTRATIDFRLAQTP